MDSLALLFICHVFQTGHQRYQRPRATDRHRECKAGRRKACPLWPKEGQVQPLQVGRSVPCGKSTEPACSRDPTVRISQPGQSPLRSTSSRPGLPTAAAVVDPMLGHHVPERFYLWPTSPPSPHLQGPSNHSSTFSDFTYKWDIQYFSSVWPILLNMMPSRFMSVVINIRISFSFYGWVTCHWMYIHSSFDGSIGYFHIMNNAATNMEMPISLQYTDVISFGHIPRSRLAGSDGSFILNILKSFLTL